MNNPDRAVEAAAQLLLGQRLYSLSIDVTRLRYDRDIRFDSMQHYCRLTRSTMEELRRFGDLADGCTINTVQNEKPCHVVLYNEDQGNLRRRNFTLAHEVGHILLNHRQDDREQEQEADRFASQLLLPRVLLWELQNRRGLSVTAGDLCEVFSLSRQAAQFRMRQPVRREDFSPVELQLLDKLEGLLPSMDGPVITV